MRVLTWEAGRAFTRAHSHLFGSSEFDDRTSTDLRFSPVRVGGHLAPVVYAGADDRTAAAETIFHTGEHGRPPTVQLRPYLTWQWSTVRCTRDLRLAAIDATHHAAAEMVDGNQLTNP